MNAFLGIDADGAHAAAQDADRRRAAGEDGPLLGVPIALKDDLDAAGPRHVVGHPRAHGRRRARTVRSSPRCARAGAVPIGRTTLPELALYGFTESALSGITRNPARPDAHARAGRPAGSAAAVAGGAVGIATASDGAGSIRIPAACCGLVGIKPGAGRTPGRRVERAVGPGLPHAPGRRLRAVPRPRRRLPEPARRRRRAGPAAPADRRRPRLARDARAARSIPSSRPRSRRSAELLAGSATTCARCASATAPRRPGSSPACCDGLAASAADVDDPQLLEARTADMARLGRLVPDAAIGPARRQGETWGAACSPTSASTCCSRRRPADRRCPSGTGRPARAADDARRMARHYAHTPAWNHTGLPAAVAPGGRVGRRAAAGRAARRGRRARTRGWCRVAGTARARGAPDGARVSSPRAG